jgi:CelD/BcsL family acetyltransferase involved in cellulose biosynthesis
MIDTLDTAAAAAWRGVLARFPAEARDVYFLPEYAALYEHPGARARALVYTDGGETLLHVFMERRLGGADLVAEGVYGYGGPIATSTDGEFLAAAHAALAERQRAAGVISEFVRFHPLLANQRWAPAAWAPTLDRHTVAVDLASAAAEREAAYAPTQRNRLRRARRAGVVVERSESPADRATFAALYAATMRRNAARSFYLFGADYFAALWSGLADRAHLFVARHGGRVVAGALVLAHGPFLHHHLSASAAEAQVLAPNNLLFHEIGAWGTAQGFRWFHLGGGRTSAPDDELLRFKARFSGVRLPFWIGRIVHDAARHARRREAWLARHPGRAADAARYFQVYALEPEEAAR